MINADEISVSEHLLDSYIVTLKYKFLILDGLRPTCFYDKVLFLWQRFASGLLESGSMRVRRIGTYPGGKSNNSALCE